MLKTDFLYVALFIAQVSSESSVKQAIKTVVDKCGPLRAVVNTAGIMKIAGTLSDNGNAHSLSLFEEITKVQSNLFIPGKTMH